MLHFRPVLVTVVLALAGCNGAREMGPMAYMNAKSVEMQSVDAPSSEKVRDEMYAESAQNRRSADADRLVDNVQLGGANSYAGVTVTSGGSIKMGAGTLTESGTLNGIVSGTGGTLLLAQAPVAPIVAADVQRMVIYNATLGLVVPDIGQTMATIQSQTKGFGGYMQEILGGAITVRVPVARFEEALSGFEKLGEVTQRRIKADDITEQMHDLKIRLENAESVRKRLLDLVEKSTKVEDTLKIEQELMRLSEVIELYKGKIKFLSAQAAYSTIRMELNSPLPQKQAVVQLPFAWIRALADGAVAGTAEGSPDTSRWERRGIKFELPKSYIRYYERDFRTEAMSASGITVKLQRQDNYDGGDLAFWSKLARRALVEIRTITVTKEYETTLNNKVPVQVILGTKDVGSKKTGYMLVLVPGKRYVYTFEAWGEQEELMKDFAGLEAAAKTMDVGK